MTATSKRNAAGGCDITTATKSIPIVDFTGPVLALTTTTTTTTTTTEARIDSRTLALVLRNTHNFRLRMWCATPSICFAVLWRRSGATHGPQ